MLGTDGEAGGGYDRALLPELLYSKKMAAPASLHLVYVSTVLQQMPGRQRPGRAWKAPRPTGADRGSTLCRRGQGPGAPLGSRRGMTGSWGPEGGEKGHPLKGGPHGCTPQARQDSAYLTAVRGR